MKFENIEVGMKLQHKKTGKVYKVVALINDNAFELNKEYKTSDGFYMDLIFKYDAKLFRKYKGD